MAKTETLRPEASPSLRPEQPRPEQMQSAGLSPAQFLSGREEDRLAELLAFALAAEAGHPVGQEGVERLRRAAASELDRHAFVTLHNRVQEIRREAVAEELAKLRHPPGFVSMVFAVLVALAIAGAAAWFALPHLSARFAA
jgi:hypothetical protein